MSLSQAKTAEVILAEILMEETIHRGGFLLVEGEDDARFWKGRVKRSSCKIIVCEGKVKAIETANKLDLQENQRVLGVVDADFDRLLENEYLFSERLVMTDEHDLDVMLLLSSASGKVLLEQADEERFSSERNQDLHECILDYALIFGRLRYLHSHLGCAFKFDRFNPYIYVDHSNFQLDEQRLILAFQEALGVDSQQMDNLLVGVPSNPIEELIQGHDTLRIVCIALKGTYKSDSSRSIDESELRKFLRLAFHHRDLCRTEMYQALLHKNREWGLDMFPVCT